MMETVTNIGENKSNLSDVNGTSCENDQGINFISYRRCSLINKLICKLGDGECCMIFLQLVK